MTTKYDIRRSIDEGRPVLENEPVDELSAARGIINGLAITLAIGFLIWAAWMIFK